MSGKNGLGIVPYVFLIQAYSFAQVLIAIGNYLLVAEHGDVQNVRNGFLVELIVGDTSGDVRVELTEHRLSTQVRKPILHECVERVLLLMEVINSLRKWQLWAGLGTEHNF